MTKAIAIDHINMNVRNIEETRRFYQGLFEKIEVKESGKSPSGKDYEILKLDDSFLLCLYNTPDLKVNEGEPINHFGIHISNFDETYSRLKANGVPIGYGGIVEYPQSRSIYVTDPNGLEIELSEKFGGNL